MACLHCWLGSASTADERGSSVPCAYPGTPRSLEVSGASSGTREISPATFPHMAQDAEKAPAQIRRSGGGKGSCVENVCVLPCARYVMRLQPRLHSCTTRTRNPELLPHANVRPCRESRVRSLLHCPPVRRMITERTRNWRIRI